MWGPRTAYDQFPLAPDVDGGENPRIDGAIAADATDARRACSPLRRLAPEPKFDKLVCAVVRCSAHFDVDMNYFG